ncbi:zinc-dependent metalloprotease family protein [Methanoplanus limicola]|uniref:zinc-dependent metalloprotease family protein n=1 Tax=Methanoplanus limicola TaxID=2315 RepID=UPI00064F44F6|nr:zinc-dependent metalloprotease family protein [Methanoplanus limicola]
MNNYELESNWVSSAQSYMAQAAYQYQRSDIDVFLNVVEYDASKKDILSSNANTYRRMNEPLDLFKDIFETSYLNNKNADVAIYLGGNDMIGSAQGLAWGFQAYLDGYLEHCRYAWSQMVDDSDTIDLYDGSYHARVYCILHEMGHVFFANHENSGGTNQAYVWFESLIIPKNTVMWSIYKGSITTQCEYSSPSYHGDSNHNNAGSISLAKSYVADFCV